MRAAGFCAVNADVNSMVITYSWAFPADSLFIAGGLDVIVARADSLQFPMILSSQLCVSLV